MLFTYLCLAFGQLALLSMFDKNDYQVTYAQYIE